jgi:hypothetical protein
MWSCHVVVHDRNRFDEFQQINHIPTRAPAFTNLVPGKSGLRYRSTHGKEDR